MLPVNKSGIIRTGCSLLFLFLLVIPASGALTDSTDKVAGQSTVIQDSARLISPLKMHVAYVGKTQEARMEGVITYIDRISGETGTATLREIQEDYLVAALQVPVMRTVGEITAAREEMRHQSILFFDETNTQMARFNGSVDDMRLSAAGSLRTVENSFNCMQYSSWLASKTTRLLVFNQSSERRTAMLEDLSIHGLDVSYPRNLSEQIDAQHTELEQALLQDRDGVLSSLNNGLRLLNEQFRTTVEGYKANLLAQQKAAGWTP